MSIIKGISRHLSVLLLAVSAGHAPGALAQPAPASEVKAQDPEEAAAAQALCSAMVKGVNALPKNAGTADLEAALAFAISQSPALQPDKKKDNACHIVELALQCTVKAAPRQNLPTAVANIRDTCGVGTGATRSGGASAFSGNSGFSQPLVGIGGGSTNYTVNR